MCELFAHNKIELFLPKLLGEHLNAPLAKEASIQTYTYERLSKSIYSNDNNQATSVNKRR